MLKTGGIKLSSEVNQIQDYEEENYLCHKCEGFCENINYESGSVVCCLCSGKKMCSFCKLKLEDEKLWERIGVCYQCVYLQKKVELGRGCGHPDRKEFDVIFMHNQKKKGKCDLKRKELPQRTILEFCT